MDETKENPQHRLTRRSWFVALGLLLAIAGALGLWKRFGSGLPQISVADLKRAQQRWEASVVPDYNLTVVLAGRQTGEIQLQVRNGEPVSMTRNGVTMREPRTWQPWTVPGMFDTLQTDFENAAKPAEKFGSPDVQIVLRAQFDEQYGYPRRYLQQIFGRLDDLSWTVTQFDVVNRGEK